MVEVKADQVVPLVEQVLDLVDLLVVLIESFMTLEVGGGPGVEDG